MPSLQVAHPLPHDGEVVLVADSHTYHRGPLELAARSVTTVVESCFEEFDAKQTVSVLYTAWKSSSKSKYYDTIHTTLNGGGDDEDAKAAIQQLWVDKGRLAREAGTRAHEAMELIANGLPCAASPEVRLFRKWWEGRGLQFFRSELITFIENKKGNLLLAGSVDMIATDDQGRHVLIDYKRSEKRLTIDEPAYKGKKGKGILSHVPDTAFWKYSLQMSLYAIMIQKTQGVDCGDRMYIVNVHPSLCEACESQAADLRSIAEELLDQEESRQRDARKKRVRGEEDMSDAQSPDAQRPDAQRKESEQAELLAAAYWGIVPQILKISDLVKRDDLIEQGEIEEGMSFTQVCAKWMSDCQSVGAEIHEQGGCVLMRWAVEKFVPRDQHCVFDAGFDKVGNDADRWGQS